MRIALDQIRGLCTIVAPVDEALHRRGLALAERYGFLFFDALIVGAALRAGSVTLLSEDMHHGLVVEDKLTILDPFT